MSETTFEEFYDMNPRGTPEDMEEFLEYAKKEYEKAGDAVNWSYPEGSEEFKEEVEDYIRESMEAILLFKKFLKEKEQKVN